jgi:hypothetical protein
LTHSLLFSTLLPGRELAEERIPNDSWARAGSGGMKRDSWSIRVYSTTRDMNFC